MLIRSLIIFATLITSLSAAALPETPEEYITVFKSGWRIDKEKAAETLAWAGISSPLVFDIVEQELLSIYPTAKTRVAINYASWLVKALSFSGNEKYRPTINQVTAEGPHRKLRNYAKWAQNNLALYTRLNKLISPNPWPESPYPLLDQRLTNMLNSDDLELFRIAAKRIHYTHNYKPELLKLLDDTIKANYKKSFNANGADAMAWLCKALAGSRATEYKTTIETVEREAGSSRLRLSASHYLAYFSN